MDFPDGFEWDPEKARTNLSKHGVAFYDIVRLFDSPVIEDHDPRHSETEDRFLAFGLLEGVVCCVAFTYRGERRRLIGARRATPLEARMFYSRLFGDPIL
ncbi:MAG TPA: BrnT family toxin [Rhodospirillales bacterium]|jgi:hypothetical protein